MLRKIDVQGTVAEGFEEVREEFSAVLAEERSEPGAQLAAYVNARLVVDLWSGEEVTGDSLTGVYSSTKGATYLVVALLVQEGMARPRPDGRPLLAGVRRRRQDRSHPP